jgi:polysaccharide export outer membrane protein
MRGVTAMLEKHEAINGLFLAVVIAVFATGCAAGSGTAKTEALIANVTRDDTRDNLALNSRILALANTATSLRDYSIGPADLLEISIFDIPELSKIKARVASEGHITLPLVGTVQAGGKTAMELEETLKTALASKYIRNPQVSVFLLEYRSQRISVLGAVKKPGVFEVSGPRSLVDMLSMAEGLTEQADQVVFLMRKVAKSSPPETPGSPQQPSSDGRRAQEAIVEIDLDDLLVDGKGELNVPLQAGDVVHVPKAGSVFVGGEVQKPGSLMIKGKTLTVDQAIIEAGGLTKVADFEGVRVFRDRGGKKKEIIEVNLNEIEQGKKGPLVMKNDVILVSSHGGKVFMYGLLDFFRFGIGATVF